jgi:peptidyl-prolyl cis-trans isomerase A (cyclophilin A)
MSRGWIVACLLVSSVCFAADPAPKADAKAKTPTKEKKMYAVFETSMGNFKALLYADKAPKTVANFKGLATGTKEWTNPKTHKKEKKPLYDGTIFHRIIKSFMIQGGDPQGDGRGGPGFQFDNEISPDLKHNKPGILAMANAGPNTNGSQFYVTIEAKPYLDGSYSIFGEVVEGMDVVKKISEVATNPQDKPLKDVVLKKVKIEEK